MERRAIAISGTVQGVGFRPFVYGLASQFNLAGFVNNNGGGVTIEVEGEPGQLDQFLTSLTVRPPPLAKIEELAWERRPVLGDRTFHITGSTHDSGSAVVISPDIATCDDCVAELFDPTNHRYRYPFLNCTNCGPRLTIVTGAPYDRASTTMASFAMCPKCQAEYDDPLNRRFHAQPTACAVCGPRLSAADAQGRAVETSDPIQWFVAAIRAGQIGALKGLGGYHLVCDARNGLAIVELRRRKHRDEKPLAVMVADIEAARVFCEIDPAETNLLTSSRRPIVLLRKRGPVNSSSDCKPVLRYSEEPDLIGESGSSEYLRDRLAEAIAPQSPTLGIMLPYTPLHHLLLREMDGPLVMTSGNRADEPIATREPEVFQILAGIADVFLTHNRPIHVRCDDSVTRIVGQSESPIRRSRGYAPQPIRLPLPCPAPVLAVGAQLKGTFALGRDRRAIISHHLGDLDHFEAYRAFEKDITLYERLFEIKPKYIAHDLHPDYASTHYAQQRREAEGITLIPVQHHHAHMASCMAEHGITDSLIGVCFDGTGYGTDGAIWGGEFLFGNLQTFTRAAHLRYVAMPGGDKAATEPWRMAIAHLADANVDCPSLRNRVKPTVLRTIEQMLDKKFNSPMTSSAGRLFDAVAAIIGLRDRMSFEGQAAMELQALAESVVTDESYPFDIEGEVIDTRPMIRAIAADVQSNHSQAIIARRFHNALAEMIAKTCDQIRDQTKFNTVVLSGGVFMNALLSAQTVKNLCNKEFNPLCNRHVPANDGGISLGQLAVASRLIGGIACV